MNSDVLLCCTGRHAPNKRLITFGDNYEKGRAMPYIPDGQVLAVPSRAYPPSSGCSWWKWRKPARSALKVEAVRTFGWLAPGHKFPVGQVDSKNVLEEELLTSDDFQNKMYFIKLLCDYYL